MEGKQIISENFMFLNLTRILLIVVSIICNSVMIKYFLKSMDLLGSSKANIYNFTVNFFLTTLFDKIFFNSAYSKQYYLGITLMIIGIIIISKIDSNSKLKHN
jgi:drug/metabolite transporter (DMT)-like permease